MPTWERWSLAFDDRMPIYRQIVLQFSRAFVRGEIQPGARVPSIRELSALLKVNTNTMQRAYQEMERDELINSKRGTGYFFTEDETMMEQTRRSLALESLRRFVDEMRALGCGDKDILDELTEYMKGDGSRDADT
ncbi:MAG: GntR family transcriptional regulator [Oscillospiraceae bacterium]|jgi:GntR family transcriptional regulator|nr:GntR family transcriptional regulator [Oscillospiraceae bacterium]